jgi:hypothetical protein
LKRFITILAAVFCLGTLALPAQANNPQQSGDTSSGSFVDDHYRNDNDIIVSWKDLRSSADGGNHLTIAVQAGSLAQGKCVQAAFDWQRYDGHYDSRVVRVCKDGGFRETSNDVDPEPGLCFGGGVCNLRASMVQVAIFDKSSNSLDQDTKECWDLTGVHTCAGWNPDVDLDSTFSALWLRRTDGTIAYSGIGHPLDPNS